MLVMITKMAEQLQSTPSRIATSSSNSVFVKGKIVYAKYLGHRHLMIQTIEEEKAPSLKAPIVKQRPTSASPKAQNPTNPLWTSTPICTQLLKNCRRFQMGAVGTIWSVSLNFHVVLPYIYFNILVFVCLQLKWKLFYKVQKSNNG